MRKSKKKLLAMLLAGTMVFGMLPSNAFANNEQDPTSTVVDETVTTDDSTKLEEEGDTNQGTTEVEAPVEEANPQEAETENKTEEALPEDNANTEVAVDLSLEEIKLQKTEEIKAGEKYIIVYDNKKALSTGKDNIIAVPVEIEGDTVKTEITKNIIWTVDDKGNLTTEEDKYLTSDLELQEKVEEGQFFKFDKKNVSYEENEVNTYLTYSEEKNEWSFEEKENEAVTYYNVVGPVEKLEELTEEEIGKFEEANKSTESTEIPVEETTHEGDDKVGTPEDEVEGDEEVVANGEDEDIPTTFEVGDVTYILDEDGVDSGSEYLIVATSTDRALRRNGTSVARSSELGINNYTKVITDIKNALVWTFEDTTNGYYIKNGNYYFRFESTGDKMLSNSTNNREVMSVVNKGNGKYTIKRNDEDRYLTYSNSNSNFTYNDTSSNTVRLYKKVVEEETPIPAVYFPVTMYNYDADTFNAAATGTGRQVRFTSNAKDETDPINKWISKDLDTRTIQGIVGNSLVNGKIQFNFNQAGIFDTSVSPAGREVYTNVKFPFIKDSDGYYTFDSSKNHVHFNSTNGETINLYNGSQSIAGSKTFFPFNKEGDPNTDVHFGMNMGVSFIMPTTGNVNGKDIKFEFSGDDDVWVFIDNKLVLDLGGIHGVVTGSINLTNGTVDYAGNEYIRDTNDVSINPELNLYNLLGKSESEFRDGGVHTLQIYYLERGASDSNCKIKFNLPQQDVLEISKKLGDTTPNTNQEFEFAVKNGEELQANKEYYLYKGQTLVKKDVTNSDGKLTLRAGETARFFNPDAGKYIITETDRYGFDDISWAVTSKIGSETATTESNNGNIESPVITVVKSPELNDDGSTNTNKNVFTAVCTNSTDFTLQNDVIVLDYGKKVQFNVTSNDSLTGVAGTELVGIAKAESIAQDDKNNRTLSSSIKFSEDVNLTNGSVKAISKVNNQIEYVPTKFMDSIEKATYAVKYEVSSVSKEEVDIANNETKQYKYKYADVTIMPATTVYYEDNFLSQENKNPSNGIVFTGEWTPVTDKATNTSGSNQDNGTVATDKHPYGYDTSYKNDSKFSGGSALMISSSSTKTNTAEFKFNGTGFDLISRTDNNTGSIIVEVSGSNLAKSFKTIVNNKYTTENGVLYQIPVIKFRAEDWLKEGASPYGEYTVKITVGKTNFYLDAIRLYNPLGFNNDEANDQYKDDKEFGANVREVRNLLISNAPENGNINGIVYVDGKNGINDVKTYKEIGPNNEVYLKKGNTIAFKIGTVSDASSIQLGVKSADGNVGKLEVLSASTSGEGVTTKDITLSTSTDMYYDITDVAKRNGGVVYIRNNSDLETIISITNLKITCNDGIKEFGVTVDNDVIVSANMLAYEVSTNKSADIDGSGAVDIMDLAAVASNQDKEVIIGVSTDIYRQDLTGTRTIDREDLNIVKDNIQ